MLSGISNYNNLDKIRPLFNDIRFYMGNSTLDGLMGQAYVDNVLNPHIAFLVVRKYCFMSGELNEEKLKSIIDKNFKNYVLIPSDNLKKKIENIYQNSIVKSQRYSIKKEVVFNKNKLNDMINKLPQNLKLIRINKNLSDRIKKENFINITDNYEKNGIGYCCMHENEIIGVASSNIFYKDGIEVNIKVKENYRRKGIASAMAANLILDCLKENKKISWDAANMNSVRLAQKLGFEFDSAYDIYEFWSDYETGMRKKTYFVLNSLI